MTVREFFSKLGRFLSSLFIKIRNWVSNFNLFKKQSVKKAESADTPLSSASTSPPLDLDTANIAQPLETPPELAPPTPNVPAQNLIPPTTSAMPDNADTSLSSASTSPPSDLDRAMPDNEVDDEGFTELMIAVKDNDINAFKRLLKDANVNVNQTNKQIKNMLIYPNTALGLAVQNINIEMIELLLEARASIQSAHNGNWMVEGDSKKHNTWTVLNYLPDSNSTMPRADYKKLRNKIFELIANQGKIVIKPDNIFFVTALATGHMATLQNTLDFIREDPEDINRFYNIPITTSLSYPWIYEGTPKINGLYYHTPISYALANKQPETTLFMLNNAVNDITDPTELKKILNRALIFSIYYKEDRVTKYCLEHLSPEEISEHVNRDTRFTALMAAAYMGNLPLMKHLLERKVDINHMNPPLWRNQLDINQTALYSAIKSDMNLEEKEEIVTLLLNHGAKLNSVTLDLMIKSNYTLNLEKVNTVIEYSDEDKHEPGQYSKIKKQIQDHNEAVLRSKTLDILHKEVPGPTVIHKIVTDYLFAAKEKPAAPAKPEDEEPNKTPKP